MRPSNRGGFTFVELLVGLAIMVMIATVVTPTVFGALDRSRVETSAETLQSFVLGILEFEADTGEYPGELAHLTTPVTGSQRNSCGNNYRSFPPTQSVPDRWDGPYTSQAVGPSGKPIPIGTVRNQLERITLNGTHGLLRVNVDGVRLDDATALNASVDGDGSGTAGTVQWTGPDAQGLVVLHYVLDVHKC